ncbi:hypothetical protein [Chromobacterium amazonense]|uniref:hypothetical protein n=1 Tax=Chromobacterium amazonense TaxID=1382803 RepID=UPI0011B23F02|nr:hypothetical protein [Chromobacterium amazonense]
MKTERITFLGSPEFKTFLAEEAAKEGISVGELVRRRCEGAPTDDETLLAAMAAELTRAVADAKQSLEDGLSAVREALGEPTSKPRAAA